MRGEKVYTKHMIRDKFERFLNGQFVALNTGEQIGYLKRLQKQYPSMTDERIEQLPDADCMRMTKDMKGESSLILITDDVHYLIKISTWKITVSCKDTSREEKL